MPALRRRPVVDVGTGADAGPGAESMREAPMSDDQWIQPSVCCLLGRTFVMYNVATRQDIVALNCTDVDG